MTDYIDRDLTLLEAEIAHDKITGMKNPEVMEKYDISVDRVKRIMRTEAVHKIQQAALLEKGWDFEDQAEELIKMVKAKKEINVGGELVEAVDNVARIAALKEIGLINGIYAPRQFNLEHSTAQIPLEKLAEEAEASLEELQLDGPTGEQAVNPNADIEID